MWGRWRGVNSSMDRTKLLDYKSKPKFCLLLQLLSRFYHLWPHPAVPGTKTQITTKSGTKLAEIHHVFPSPPFKFTGMFCKKRPHLSAASTVVPHPSSPILTTHTFSTFLFVRPVEGQPEHSPSSTMFPHISIHKTNHKSLFSPWNCQQKVFWTHIICFQHSFPESDAKVKINVLFLKMSH